MTVTAVARDRHERTERLTSLEAVEAVWSQDDVVLWLDLEAPSPADINWVQQLFQIEPEFLHECERCERRPQFQPFTHYMILVCYTLGDFSTSHDPRWQTLRICCGEGFLITVHADPIQMIQTLHDQGPPLLAQMLEQGVDGLLHRLLDHIVDDYILATQTYQTHLDQAEDKSLTAHVDDSLLEELMDLRRPLLDLHHIITLQHELLMRLLRDETSAIRPQLAPRFEHIRHHLAQAITLIDGQRELLSVIRENYNTTLANRMNEVMKTLTVFASLLLPLSFIAGFYGMNLPLWPSSEDPASLWWVLGAMGTLAVGLLVFFRWRRWF